MKVSVCLFALVAAVLAEPPVPSNQYLPANNGAPNNQYGAPSFGGNGGNGFGRGNGNGNGNGNGGAPQRPGQQYGAPQQPSPQYGAPNGDEDAPASYSFEYKVEDAESGNDFGHMESREGDVAQGKYYVVLPDGRKQVVEYTADSDGYHPMVTYEGEANGGNGGGYPASNGGYPSGNGQRGNGGYNY